MNGRTDGQMERSQKDNKEKCDRVILMFLLLSIRIKSTTFYTVL